MSSSSTSHPGACVAKVAQVDLRQAAVGYAQRGIAVLPLFGTVNGRCECGNADCQHPGKHPRVSGGHRSATSDASTVDGWWTAHPNANIGIPTGAMNNLVVLDADTPEAAQRLASDYSTLSVPQVGTGRGSHFYFRAPSQVSVRTTTTPNGIDVKGEGGFVVAPPSRHADGAQYRYVSGAELTDAQVLPELPQQWQFKQGKHAVAASEPGVSPLLADVVPQGQRHNTMVQLAGALLGKGVPRQLVENLVIADNARRSVPPLDHAEITALVESLARKEAIKGAAGFQPLAEVPPERVRWVWPARIPLGKITILQGDPGEGKSTIAADLAARVTRAGAMPDGTRGIEGGVLWLTVEDGIGDTLRPRLEAAGANVSRVITLREHADEILTFPNGLETLKQAVCRSWGGLDCPFRLVVIDPLDSFVDKGLKLNSPAEARRFMNPLACLAAELNLTVLIINHLNKAEAGTQTAMQRGGGSIGGIAGSARAVLHVGPGANDSDEHVLAVVKVNNGKPGSSLVFQIADTHIADADDRPIDTSKVEWLGTTTLFADDLVADATPARMSKVEEATQFLREQLSGGTALTKAEIEKLATERGINMSAVDRASRLLPMDKVKRDAASWWRLPPERGSPQRS